MSAVNAIEVRRLNAGYGNRAILSDVSVAIPAGKVTAIIGANGCGKSTLLKCIAGVLNYGNGEVHVDGRSSKEYSRRELARIMSLLPQSPVAPEGITVSELVRFGRQPHHGLIARHSADDAAAVESALQAADMEKFADRPVDMLSGGQRQRAWIAMSLAQQADMLLLDEPTTYLDIQNQTEVLKLLRQLNVEEGRTVVMVLHDLNQAARYADYIVAMCEGGIAAAGQPQEVMTEELVKRVFGLEVKVVDNPLDGTPLCLPVD